MKPFNQFLDEAKKGVTDKKFGKAEAPSKSGFSKGQRVAHYRGAGRTLHGNVTNPDAVSGGQKGAMVKFEHGTEFVPHKDLKDASQYWKDADEKMRAQRMREVADCRVCGQTPCNCTFIEESHMSEVHASIAGHVDRHVKAFKQGKLGMDQFGSKITAAHKKVAAEHGIEHKHAVKLVNDYVDSALNEEVELDEGTDLADYHDSMASKHFSKMKDATDNETSHKHSTAADLHIRARKAAMTGVNYDAVAKAAIKASKAAGISEEVELDEKYDHIKHIEINPVGSNAMYGYQTAIVSHDGTRTTKDHKTKEDAKRHAEKVQKMYGGSIKEEVELHEAEGAHTHANARGLVGKMEKGNKLSSPEKQYGGAVTRSWSDKPLSSETVRALRSHGHQVRRQDNGHVISTFKGEHGEKLRQSERHDTKDLEEQVELIGEQFSSKDAAVKYAKDKVKTHRDPDDGIEIYHKDGQYHVNHTANSAGRESLRKSGAKHVTTVYESSRIEYAIGSNQFNKKFGTKSQPTHDKDGNAIIHSTMSKDGKVTHYISGGKKANMNEEVELDEMAMDAIKHPVHGKIEWRNENGAHMITSKNANGSMNIHAIGDHKEIASKWSKLKSKMQTEEVEHLDEISADVAGKVLQARQNRLHQMRKEKGDFAAAKTPEYKKELSKAQKTGVAARKRSEAETKKKVSAMSFSDWDKLNKGYEKDADETRKKGQSND